MNVEANTIYYVTLTGKIVSVGHVSKEIAKVILKGLRKTYPAAKLTAYVDEVIDDDFKARYETASKADQNYENYLDQAKYLNHIQ